jgi:hypothetical protein
MSFCSPCCGFWTLDPDQNMPSLQLLVPLPLRVAFFGTHGLPSKLTFKKGILLRPDYDARAEEAIDRPRLLAPSLVNPVWASRAQTEAGIYCIIEAERIIHAKRLLIEQHLSRLLGSSSSHRVTMRKSEPVMLPLKTPTGPPFSPPVLSTWNPLSLIPPITTSSKAPQAGPLGNPLAGEEEFVLRGFRDIQR